jgi:hypothetical protein
VKQSFSCLVLAPLAALCLCNQSAAATAAPVTLYTDFQQAVSPVVLEAVRTEVDSIMSPMGLRFDWQSLSDFRPGRASAAVAMAHFEGRCDVSGLVMRGNKVGSLGWTEISDGTILPFTHVDCEQVRTFFADHPAGLPPSRPGTRLRARTGPRVGTRVVSRLRRHAQARCPRRGEGELHGSGSACRGFPVPREGDTRTALQQGSGVPPSSRQAELSGGTAHLSARAPPDRYLWGSREGNLLVRPPIRAGFAPLARTSRPVSRKCVRHMHYSGAT